MSIVGVRFYKSRSIIAFEGVPIVLGIANKYSSDNFYSN